MTEMKTAPWFSSRARFELFLATTIQCHETKVSNADSPPSPFANKYITRNIAHRPLPPSFSKSSRNKADHDCNPTRQSKITTALYKKSSTLNIVSKNSLLNFFRVECIPCQYEEEEEHHTRRMGETHCFHSGQVKE